MLRYRTASSRRCRHQGKPLQKSILYVLSLGHAGCFESAILTYDAGRPPLVFHIGLVNTHIIKTEQLLEKTTHRPRSEEEPNP